MDHRLDSSAHSADPGRSADDEVADLVRDLASTWTMPPRRSDAIGWQARVRATSTRRRGVDQGRHWLMLVGRAAGLAAAGTLALALVAVWLTMPRTPSIGTNASVAPPASVGPAAAPPASATPRATPSAVAASGSSQTTAPTPTALPAYARFGAPVSPSRLVVGTGDGYQLLDLSMGSLGAPFIGSGDAYAALFQRPDGTLVSLTPTDVEVGGADGVAATIHFFDASGTATGSFTARTYLGRPDPAVKISGTNIVSASQGTSAAVEGMLSPDGSQLYLGWSVRTPPVWQTGIDVVDLASRAIVQTVHLSSASSSRAGAANYAWPPSVGVSPDGRHVAVLGTTVDAAGAASSVRWSAPLVAGKIGALTPFASGPGTLADCDTTVEDEGFATNTTYYAVCSPGGDAAAMPVLRRVDLAGRPLGDTVLANITAGPFPGAYGRLIDRSSASYYAWNPFSGVLIRLDLASGKVTGSAIVPQPKALSGGPLAILDSIGAQLGRWLAPSAAAKMYLQPSLALSPDRSRLYVLAATGTSSTDTTAGSSGVWVFDARSLALVGHWAPTADFISIAVSPDGAYAYAAGMPGNDASGNQTGQDGSVTVYQASDGQVRVIAGHLGQAYLDLAPAESYDAPIAP